MVSYSSAAADVYKGRDCSWEDWGWNGEGTMVETRIILIVGRLVEGGSGWGFFWAFGSTGSLHID